VGQVLALDAVLVSAAKPHDALPFGLGHPGLTAYVAAKIHGVVPCSTVAAAVAVRKYVSPRCTGGGEGRVTTPQPRHSCEGRNLGTRLPEACTSS
jgi:hypothetical protein